MQQLLPQNNILVPGVKNSKSTVNYINDYIDSYNCEKLCVDISFLNIIDASYVATVCSTKHFVKYPNGKISWKISSNIVKECANRFQLGNTEFI